jgi:hypothetical protein
MAIPGFLERHLDNLASGITRNPALSFSAFLLFADSLLVRTFRVNLLAVDANWVKGNLGIVGLLLLLGAYIVVQEVAFPCLRVFFGLPALLATEVLIGKALRRLGVPLGARIGIRGEDFFVYSIVKNNSVAYEEYKRRKADQADRLRRMDISLGLLALVMVNVLASGEVRTISIMALWWSFKLPPVMFIALMVMVLLIILSFLISGLVATRFEAGYFAIFNTKLYDDMEGFFELEQQKPSIDSRFRNADDDGAQNAQT